MPGPPSPRPSSRSFSSRRMETSYPLSSHSLLLSVFKPALTKFRSLNGAELLARDPNRVWPPWRSSCVVGYAVDKISLDPLTAVRPPESEKHRWSEFELSGAPTKYFGQIKCDSCSVDLRGDKWVIALNLISSWQFCHNQELTAWLGQAGSSEGPNRHGTPRFSHLGGR